MNIEFHTPNLQVKEWIISHITGQLLGLQQRHKRIVRAQVYFRQQDEGGEKAKLCQIDLSILKDSILVQRKAESYEQAMREVLAALSDKVDERVRIRDHR